MQICPSCGEENPERFRLCGFCGTALTPDLPSQEVRKTVTIVFSDLKGSTAMGEKLDSEAVREVMSRYFDEMRAALERHGGTVEKYIGDAIMAVFGLPKLHEDDALRAVRAAGEMRERLAELNEELDRRWGVTVGNRTGVNTGEVVAGDPTTGQRLVTGDTVNTAARLEQAAPTNEVLLGESTLRLVRHAVEVEPVEPLELKGKADRVPAYQLVSVRAAEGVERRRDSTLIGREEELADLLGELETASRERTCRTITVLAQAGVGKSRLIEELVRSAGPGTRVVRGRCLSYGRGITFWPLVEIVREAAGIRDEDSPGQALAKLTAVVGEGNDDVVVRVASAVGLADGGFSLDEVFWGTRRLFELLAARGPLVVVFDDIHWAELAFLDLIENVATTTVGSPILLVCGARPELLELRPAWAKPGAHVIELKPLSAEDSGRIVDQLLDGAPIPPAVRDRIVTAAEGNPLFVEQLLSMLIDDGSLRRDGDHWHADGNLAELAIPGTIQALLAARLDLLSAQERAVIEPASVAGLVFERLAVEELAPDAVRSEVDAHLSAMTQKQLVRPEESSSTADYRFQHILIRDAAYRGILKRARATLHERFVDWAEPINRERDRGTEFEEILGYHLEQAYGYLGELGPHDEHGLELGRRAAAYLSSAGNRAFARSDMAAAANLLRRAATLLPEGDPDRLELLPDLGEALMEIGEFAWAEAFLDEVVDGAEAAGDQRLHANALLTRLLARKHVATDFSAWREAVEKTTSALIPQLEGMTANAELAKAWRMVAFVHAPVNQWEAAAAAQQKALEHARFAFDRRMQARMSSAYAQSLLSGPTPVEAAITACEEMLAGDLGNRQAEAIVLDSLTLLHGLNGDFEQAREASRTAKAMLDDIGASVLAASMSHCLAHVELLAERPQAAVAPLREAYETLEEMEEIWIRPSIGAMLSRALYASGAVDEAEKIAFESEGLAAEGDVDVESVCRSTRARVLAGRGDFVEAVRLAEEAVGLVPGVEAPLIRAEALVELAEVYAGAADVSRARTALEEARDLAEIKEMRVPLAHIDALLEGLGRQAAQPLSAIVETDQPL
jgi:predicted ATPase/class 3 adenylate cyclase